MCNKRQICSICEATFKMERGCFLEKRCPACRELGVIKSPYNYNSPMYIPDHAITKHIVNNPKQSYDEIHMFNYLYNALHPIDYTTLEFEYYEDTLSASIDIRDSETLINTLLAHLDKREQHIIKLRFGLTEDKTERTLEEIMQELNISRERIHQIEHMAIKKIKRYVAMNSLS